MPLTTAVNVRQRTPDPLIARQHTNSGIWEVQRVDREGVKHLVEILSDRLFKERYEVTNR